MEAKYKEPIFYHNGDYSSFLDAIKISKDGVTLSQLNYIPDLIMFKIEFSFPNSDVVIKASTTLERSSNEIFLKFIELDESSKKYIQDYIGLQKAEKSNQIVI